ncbi:YkvA family protein [Streptomyces sp. 8N706]|uniref:YkvA family protein n=1 Tax=Streptomyces sp. 8N706 TaxID=3457416 RepID=UPI003FD56AFA
MLIAGLWVASPINLIPEFLPVIGPLDDIVVVALALRYAARQVPGDALLAAWPDDTHLLERPLGPTKAPQPLPGRPDKEYKLSPCKNLQRSRTPRT